jgi:hypothetical protein
VCQKNTKNQYAVLPGISVTVLASHFSSVIGNFRSSGWPPWRTEGDENIVKSSYLNLPDIGFTLFTPIKGSIDSLTVYIYKAETCTNILRYNTCMSSYPGGPHGGSNNQIPI